MIKVPKPSIWRRYLLCWWGGCFGFVDRMPEPDNRICFR